MTDNQPAPELTSTHQQAVVEPSAIDIYASELNQLRQRVADLESHRRHRQELEPAECPHCNKMFKNKYILKTHIENMHNENRQRHQCSYCNKSFASKYYLAKHIHDKHPEPVTESNDDESEDSVFAEE